MIVGLCGQAGSGKDAAADFLVKNHGFVKVAFADPLKRICQDVYGFTDQQLWGPSACRNAPDERWPHGAEEYRKAAYRDFELGKQRAQSLLEADHPWQDDQIVVGYLEGAVNYATEGWLTPRLALQKLGTEWGRFCSPDTWVRYALNVHDRLQFAHGEAYYEAKTGVRSLLGTGALMSAKTDIVISDVRFRNEVVLLQKAGGKVVRIVRKERPAAKVLEGALFDKVPETLWDLIANTAFLNKLSAKYAAHVSETEQKELPDDLFNNHLINGGASLELLEAGVAGLAEALRAA